MLSNSRARKAARIPTTDVTVTLQHRQGTDTALGTLATKNPPIDADKAIYRDSTSSDGLVTSTWTQVKAFLKTYFDTLYDAAGTAAGKIASTISDGDTTHAPDGNSVFDALALKAPLISPAFTTPNLGTPSAGTLTSCTGLPQAGVVGLTTADSPLFAGLRLIADTGKILQYYHSGVAGETAIATLHQANRGGAVTIIYGEKNDNSAIKFIDMVLWLYDVAAVTNWGGKETGSPAARTYSVATNTLSLAMAANTYRIATTTFSHSPY